MVVRWIAARQARVRISARHLREVPPTEPAAVKIWKRALAHVTSEWIYECIYCNRKINSLSRVRQEWAETKAGPESGPGRGVPSNPHPPPRHHHHIPPLLPLPAPLPSPSFLPPSNDTGRPPAHEPCTRGLLRTLRRWWGGGAPADCAAPVLPPSGDSGLLPASGPAASASTRPVGDAAAANTAARREFVRVGGGRRYRGGQEAAGAHPGSGPGVDVSEAVLLAGGGTGGGPGIVGRWPAATQIISPGDPNIQLNHYFCIWAGDFLLYEIAFVMIGWLTQYIFTKIDLNVYSRSSKMSITL